MSPGAEAFQAAFGVSRETMARLETHLALLEQWNPRINLVSRASLADAWTRHFADSAQLWRLRPPGARVWLDLGSGAGFPGLVVAAMAADGEPLEVHLVESDQRKAAFLATVVRETGVRATVHAERAEAMPALGPTSFPPARWLPSTPSSGFRKSTAGRGESACFPKERRCIRRSPRPPCIGTSTTPFTPA